MQLRREGAIYVSAGGGFQMGGMATTQALGKVIPALTNEDVRFQCRQGGSDGEQKRK